MKQEELKNVLHEMIREHGRRFVNEETAFRVFEMKDFENIMKHTSKLEVATEDKLCDEILYLLSRTISSKNSLNGR